MTMGEWGLFARGKLAWTDFPTSVPPVKNGAVWGKRRTSNPAAICGYFQLWNYVRCRGKKYFPYSPSAACYDVDFALSFPEHLRMFLEDVEVLHLGPQRVNWDGRVSEAWGMR